MVKVMTPSENAITAGQIGKLQELLGARLRKSELLSEPVQKVLEDHGESVVDEMVEAIRKRVEAGMLLTPRGTASGTLTQPHNPDEFYRTRPGLWVYDGFRTLVVAKAKPVEGGFTAKAAVAELTRDMIDAEIEEALPKEHLFEESVLCVLIAGLIATQAQGGEGVLLNNGYANLFYTASCVVVVDWYAGDREWGVSTWQRCDDGWFAGSRVFSPAN